MNEEIVIKQATPLWYTVKTPDGAIIGHIQKRLAGWQYQGDHHFQTAKTLREIALKLDELNGVAEA